MKLRKISQIQYCKIENILNSKRLKNLNCDNKNKVNKSKLRIISKNTSQYFRKQR